MILTKEYLEKWLDGFKKVWLDKNLKGLIPIFGKIKNYYENPFLEPGKNINDVLSFWKEIGSQKIKKIEMETISVDGNIGVVHWYFEDNSVICDGIYLIKFNEDLDCIEFKQWTVKNQK